MPPQIKSLLAIRNAITSVRLLLILLLLAIATVMVNFFVSVVHDAVLVMIAMVIATLAIYQAILRKSSIAARIDRLPILPFPQRKVRIAVGCVTFAFVGGLFMQAAGIGPRWSAFGSQFPVGNYYIAYVAALLVAVVLISAVYVRLIFVQITGPSAKGHRLIIKAAREWVITTDTAGRITSANAATLSLTGRSSAEVIGLAFEDLVEEESRAVAKAEIEATLADGVSRSFLARYRSADGSLRWMYCSSNPFSDETSVTEVLIVGRDATDRMHAEAELDLRDNLLAETELLVHVGSWEWDLATDLVRSSDELHRIYGITRNGPLTSADFFEKLHPNDLDRVRATVDKSLKTGEKFDFHSRIVVSPSETRMVHVIGRIIMDEAGSPARIVGSAQDVTERNMLTEQLRQSQKMEAVGRLAGGIAHDFNNVLTVIKTYSGFLVDALSENDAARADAEEISKAADKAAALTKQLLVFSRRQLVESTVIDLNASVLGLEEMLKRLLGEDVKFEARLEIDPWCVLADPGQIEQVLMNLVVNARDSMPEGGLLRIETANTLLGPELAGDDATEDGRYVMLSVCDTGSGMTEETRERIFEPFFTTKEPGRGTGLGLAIVYGIVNQSGGHIVVDSEVGRGTTIKIYLRKSTSDAAAVEEMIRSERPRGGSETILLVEDEDPVRTGVCRILRDGGYDVIEARNGVNAAMMWETRARPIDIVITDMVMPEMGGRELARRVRRHNSRTPILFMSGYTEDPIALFEGDASERFIGKPFTAETLLPMVRTMLDAVA